MYEKLPRPTIFAHRGASAHAPENTLAAFHLAIQQQADAIELDAGNYRSTLLRYDRPDGKVSLTCTAPPLAGIELVLPADDGGEAPDTSLILTRGQERYELKKLPPGDAG